MQDQVNETNAVYAGDFDFATLDNEFGTSTIDPDTVPDGTYQVIVDKAELTRAKTSGTPMLRFDLRILGPTYKNRHL